MELRRKICLIFSLLEIALPLSFCTFDSQTEMLMGRMDVLERRDDEKSMIIEHLTKQLVNQDKKIQAMQVTVDKLQTDLSANLQELLRKDQTISTLNRNQALLKGELRRLRNLVKVTNEQTKMTRVQTDEKTPLRKSKQHPDLQNKEHSNEHFEENERQVKHGFVGTDSGFTSVKTHGRGNLSNYQNTAESKRFVVNAEGPIAFHAVIDNGVVEHLGTNENMKFNTILLNLGNGYHSQHGLFIAPKAGLYLFSTSILSYTNDKSEFHADLTKNGVALARVFGHGDSGREDQGSVTVVVQLNVGDEVWVRHTYPTDGAIYGDRWTSFTGILISEI